MIEASKNWYNRYLGNPEAGGLVCLLIFFFVLVTFLNHMLMPVFFSVAFAYLLDWGVVALERWCKLPHTFAVIVTFLIFLAIFFLVVFALFPLLISQLSAFLKELPRLSVSLQSALEHLRHKAPYISDSEIQHVFLAFKEKLVHFGQRLVSTSLASIPNLITFIVYFVMTPLLIYFFLMDRDKILHWSSRFFPQKRTALTEIWTELHRQIGNYVRGKFMEAVIVGIATYAAFAFLGLQYAALLAAGVGLSVLVPYVGAVLITIPVVIVGVIQWGFGSHILYLLIAYGAIITLDGTVLVALLFSGTNNLHPVVIIIATLIFGGIWGFWGVFFAIPLASFAKALMEYWPINESDTTSVK